MFSNLMSSMYELTCTMVLAVLIMTIATSGELEFGTNLGLHSQQWGEETPQRPHFEENTWQLSQSTLWQFVFWQIVFWQVVSASWRAFGARVGAPLRSAELAVDLENNKLYFLWGSPAFTPAAFCGRTVAIVTKFYLTHVTKEIEK